MRDIPRDTSFDSTLAVLREGFQFIGNRSQRYQTDIFQARLLGQKIICLHGPEAAELFYDPARFMRKGGVPRRVQTTLMGKDAVQTKDGREHQQRKQLFMSLMTPESIHYLMDLMAAEWQASAREWEQQEQVILFEEAQHVLCRAACAWAGVPLPEADVRKRARDFFWMIDAFGGVGPRHWRGKRARARAERWIRRFIKQVRRGQVQVPPGSPAEAMAWFRGTDGEPFSAQMAAIELINLLRPIVAISYYIAFAAKALAEHPPYRKLLRTVPNYDHFFAQEVRRYFPFAPFLGARVCEKFEWHGFEFPKGTLTLLDIYGTHHDARFWPDPDTFYPERFRDREPMPFALIPHGGGDYGTGHRCAGERITLEALKLAVNFLALELRYDVPPQDLGFSLRRMPTYPRSGVVLENVKLLRDRSAARGERQAAAGAVGCPFH